MPESNLPIAPMGKFLRTFPFRLQGGGLDIAGGTVNLNSCQITNNQVTGSVSQLSLPFPGNIPHCPEGKDKPQWGKLPGTDLELTMRMRIVSQGVS